MAEKSNTPWTPPAGAILVEETQKQEETGWTPPSDAIPVDSDGGADMGFTKGSQEPPQQPSKPSGENGETPSPFILPIGVAAKTEGYLENQKKKVESATQRLTPDATAFVENFKKIQNQKDARLVAESPFVLGGSKTKEQQEFDKVLLKEFPTATGNTFYVSPTIENAERGNLIDEGFSNFMYQKGVQNPKLASKIAQGELTEEEKFSFLDEYYRKNRIELEEKVANITAINSSKIDEINKRIEELKTQLSETPRFNLDENNNLQVDQDTKRVDAAIKNLQDNSLAKFKPEFQAANSAYDQKDREIKEKIDQLNTKYKEEAGEAKTQEDLDRINAQYQTDFKTLSDQLNEAYSQYKSSFDEINNRYTSDISSAYENLKGTFSEEDILVQNDLQQYNNLLRERAALVNDVKSTKPFIDLMNVTVKQENLYSTNKPLVERLKEREEEIKRLSQGGFTDAVFYEDLGRRALNSVNSFATDFFLAPAGIASVAEDLAGRGGEYTLVDKILEWGESVRTPLLTGEREFYSEEEGVNVANLVSTATDQLGLIAGLAVGNAYAEARLAQQLTKTPMSALQRDLTKKVAARINTVTGATAASWNSNLKEARDMGLKGEDLASYVTFMSTLEGVSELVMPNNKIFSKETKNIMLDTFIKNIGKGRTFAAKEAFKTLGEVMGKEAFEEYMVMTGKTLETALLSLENEDVDVYIPTLEEVINTGATAMVASGVPSMVSQIGLRKDLETAAIIEGSKVDFDQLRSDITKQVESGNISLKDANTYLEKVNKQKTFNEFIPENLSLEAKVKLNPIAQQVAELTEQAKDKKGIAKKELDQEISALEDQMLSIINEDRGVAVRIPERTTVEQYGDRQEVVTKAKTQEDAIQEREAEEVPVGEQPAVSEEVVEEVRKPAKPKEAEVSPEERLISIISSLSEPSLGESVGTKAFIGDTPVSIRQEGQQIVADDGVTVRELGNIDEVGNAPISQFGLKGTSTAEVEVTGPKDVIIEGKPAKILSSRVDKKGRRVVKVKDSETGLIARIKGPRAEEIAKDLALQAEKSEESLRLIEEGKPVTAPEPITEPVLRTLPTEEIDNQIAALEKEVKEYEDMLLEEAETGMAVGDMEIVEVEGKPYLVKKKRGGEFSITNDKGLGVRGQERANVEAAFDNQQRRAQEQRLEEAAQEAERFKQEQGDKILEILDKAIAATDTRGRAYDATLGLPLFVFNSSLKIVRSAYKAGKSIAEAIQEAIDFLRSKGYDVNEDAYKARIIEEIGKEKAPVAEESIISEGVTVEGAPEGIYIDVEMIAGKEGRKLTPEEVLNAVPVEEVEFEVSDNNLLIKLPRELTSSEMMALMKATEQEAIGQLVDGKGKLYAQSEKFLQDYGGEFNPEFFKTPQKTQKYEKRPKAGNRIFNQPLTAVKGIADKYYKRVFGTERPTFKGINKIDETLAKRIADAYDKMINNPNDPEVKRAYEALAKETIDQYKEFTSAGYKIEINNEEPYNNAQEMIDDLRENKRMKIFSTESGFGDSPITDQQRKENPLLRDSGFKDVNGNTLLINDVFRAIHDFYGHAELGNGFGAIGEENAWNVHARMFSPLARRAMTSETRGQNSWVNFSGVNEEAFKLRDRARELRKQGKEAEAQELVKQVYEIMKFADQKIGLLPEEFSNVSDGPVAIPTKPTTKNLIDEAFKFADKSSFSNKVQFKKALQEKFEKDLPTLRKEYGIKDGNTLDENLKRYLTDAYLYETLLAIGAYPDAIGWYDYKTKAAMEIMALIHPEIKTDQNAKAIFTMALAITSNGNKVFDNFKEADRQYTYFKKNGKFDSKYSIGTQSSGIKSTFKFLNNLMENVPLDNFIDFLTTEVRAGDLYIREGGKKKNLLSGYAADTKVYGASIFGPKIGNGFFMNLFGVFDQLTMDRWFMRQYGRLTGTLLESGKDYEDKVKSNKARLEDAIKKLSDKEKKILLESVPQAKGRITKSNIDEIGKAIEKASAKKDIRKKLSSTEKLNEVRKAGNSLAGVLSGEIEAPTAAKREFIISIFDDVQKRLKDEYGIDMTIADLQAVNWYPEKSLYKAFKEDQSAESAATETSDNEQPDYESAAKKLAVELYNISPEKIENATRGITERGQSIAESNRRRVEEFSGENQGDNQRAIRETIIKIKKGSELSPTEKLMDSYKTWTIKTKCQ